MDITYRDRISLLVDNLITYRRQSVCVYAIGSLKVKSSAFFNSKYSDVDLLIVPTYDSLNDLVSHFEQAIKVSKSLNKDSEQLFDIFLMSSKVAPYFYSCMSIYAGAPKAEVMDRVYNHDLEINNGYILPSFALKRLYLVQAKRFCEDSLRIMPVADTSLARKTGKNLLRGLKLVVCAVETDSLDETEQSLHSAYSFKQLDPILHEKTGLTTNASSILEGALAGESIDDWPTWMIAQEDMISVLISLYSKLPVLGLKEFRFYDSMSRILQEMLVAGVKNIMSEPHLKERNKLIEVFINDAASLIVRLASSGVSELSRFNSSAPEIIHESYEVLVQNLKGGEVSLKGLASAVVLLEYAFEECIAHTERFEDSIQTDNLV